jgi:hypothetical protein
MKKIAICASLLLLLSCKQKTEQQSADESDVQFLPVVAGAAYGVGVSTEIAAAAFAAGGIYAIDCTRPVAAGEVRFFCDAPAKLGSAAVNLIVQSTKSLAGALRWSTANVLAHLAELSKFNSVTHLKSALAGSTNGKTVEEALVSPEIKSASGRVNFVAALKSSVNYLDRDKKSCNYVAQYEARIVPTGFKGGWMGGTSTRFLAKAPSAESAEAMALTACEWFTQTFYRPAPGFAGYSRSNNDCRKPRIIGNYKETYDTNSISCPGVKICTSESSCADYK